jgi:hypothetical protein
MKENDRQTVWTAVSLVVQVDAIVVKCAHRRDTIRELRRALAEVTARERDKEWLIAAALAYR